MVLTMTFNTTVIAKSEYSATSLTDESKKIDSTYAQQSDISAIFDFHIFAEDIVLNSHTNGNIATNNLNCVSQVNFGAKNNQSRESNYIYSYEKMGKPESNDVTVINKFDGTVLNDKRIDFGSTIIPQENSDKLYKENSSIRFVNVKNELSQANDLSVSLTKFETTSGVTFDNNKITVNTTEPQVLNIDASDLKNKKDIFINIQDGGTLIINVNMHGDPNCMSGIVSHYNGYNNEEPNVNYYNGLLWNLHDNGNVWSTSSTVNVGCSDYFIGSILCPSADIKYGAVNGNVVARRAIQNGQQSHKMDFRGKLPKKSNATTTEEPTTEPKTDPKTEEPTTEKPTEDPKTEEPITKRVNFSKQEVGGGGELVGATLIITDKNGNEIEKWVSSKKQNRVELKSGEYVLTEITSPKGYKIAESIKFKVDVENDVVYIKNNNSWKVVNDDTIVMYDATEDPIVTTKKVYISKQAVGGGAELEGAKLEVTDISWNPIASWTSTKDKKEIELESGIYILTEKTAPNGYEVAEIIKFRVDVDANKVYVDVDGSWKLVTDDTVVMYDAPTPIKKVKVKFSKQELGGGEELEGAKLVVKTVDGADIESWTSTSTRKEIELGVGEYTLTEITAPDGYEKAETIKFRVNDDNTVSVYDKTSNKWTLVSKNTVVMYDSPIEDDIITTIVKFSKQEVGGGAELVGAKLVVKDADGNTVEKWTSTKTKKSIELEVGEYTLTETTAPDGYEVAETIKFKVDESGKVMTFDPIKKMWVLVTKDTVVMYDSPKKTESKYYSLTFTKKANWDNDAMTVVSGNWEATFDIYINDEKINTVKATNVNPTFKISNILEGTDVIIKEVKFTVDGKVYESDMYVYDEDGDKDWFGDNEVEYDEMIENVNITVNNEVEIKDGEDPTKVTPKTTEKPKTVTTTEGKVTTEKSKTVTTTEKKTDKKTKTEKKKTKLPKKAKIKKIPDTSDPELRKEQEMRNKNKTSNNTTYAHTKTGDEVNIVFALIVLILALIFGILGFINGRKDNEDEE